MKFKNTLITLLLACSPSLFALETIDPAQINPLPAGGSGNLEASLSGYSGNSSESTLSSGGRLDYQANTTLMSLSGDYTRIRTGASQPVHQSWADAHYLDEFKHGLAAEAFVNYQDDLERSLANRTQAGAGARFTLDYEQDLRALYLDVDGLHEWQAQRYNSQDYWRGNLGITYKRQISPQAHFIADLRYQPKLSDWNNYNIYDDLAIDVNVTRAVSLNIGIRNEYDNTPPAYIHHNDTVYETGIRVQF